MTNKILEDMRASFKSDSSHYPFHRDIESGPKKDVKHGNYTLSISNANKNDMAKEGRAKVLMNPNKDNANHLGEFDKVSTKMGTTTKVSVKNNKTGETSEHHVFTNSGNKNMMTISALGSPKKENEHNSVIHSFLSGKEIQECISFKSFLSESHIEPYKVGQKVTVDGKAGEINYVKPASPDDKTDQHRYKVTDLSSNNPNNQDRLNGGNYISHSSINASLEEAVIKPDDAKRILNSHGGENTGFYSLSSRHVDSLVDTGKKLGYKKPSTSYKSYARAFHDHLNMRAKTENVTESTEGFYLNSKTGKSGQVLSTNDTHTMIKYDNGRTDKVPNDSFSKTHTRIVH